MLMKTKSLEKRRAHPQVDDILVYTMFVGAVQ